MSVKANQRYGSLVGFTFGFSTPLLANAISKEYLMRKPWLHFGLGILGAYIGYHYGDWKREKVVQYKKELFIRQQREAEKLEKMGQLRDALRTD